MHAYPHILPCAAEASGDTVVDSAQEHPVQEQDQFFVQLAAGNPGALVLDHAGEILRLKDFPYRNVSGYRLLQQDPFCFFQAEG